MLTLARALNDLSEDLNIRGYTLIRTNPSQAALTTAAASFAAHVEAKSMGVKVLESHDSPDWLPRHTENLTDPELLEYFALGCLQASATGGATCLYDGRIAAHALASRRPELTKVSITYATHWRPNTATHPLLADDPQHGPVLRYRSALETNSVLGPLPSGMTEADMYAAVEAAVTEALVIAHQWRPGDLLIVNNRTMIHSRQPFKGLRRMVRYRYDDPNFRTVIISE
ncbi:hypothetical protein GCM10027447_07750 [Glycomyces halotolerans]